MKEISERIKLIRKCTHLSKEEFSSKINKSVEVLEKWENDSESPSIEDILKISNTYGISVEFLLNGNVIDSDKFFLDRKLSKTDLTDEIKELFFNKLGFDLNKELIEELYLIAQLNDDVFARDFNLENLIFFNINDLLEIGDYGIYFNIAKNFHINGYVKFEMLNPNKHNISFYEDALKHDRINLETTFLKYTKSKELWNDEILLWMINQGATCVELVNIEEHEHHNWSIDGCPNDNTTYKPIYQENLVLTFLLKAELERKVNK